MSEPMIVEFDLDRYLRNSKKVDLGGIDWDGIPDHPLSDGDVMCLHYMMDIEAHTVIYLRDLLATRAAADPQITAFLSLLGVRGAVARRGFLRLPALLRDRGPGRAEAPRRLDPDAHPPHALARTAGRAGVGNGLGLVPTMLGSMLTRDFAAIHMMWGAVNELTTLTAYHALIRRCDHPVLHQMLRKVIQDERRHFAFYRAQAKARLQRSRAARRLVRWVLSSLWTPVGAGVKSRRRSTRSAIYLFGDGARGPRADPRDRPHDLGPSRPRGPDDRRGLPRRGTAPGGRAAGLGRHRPAALGRQRQRPCSGPPALGDGRGARGLSASDLTARGRRPPPRGCPCCRTCPGSHPPAPAERRRCRRRWPAGTRSSCRRPRHCSRR